MKSADELRAIAESHRQAAVVRRAETRAEQARRDEGQVAYYLGRMRSTFIEEAEKAARDGNLTVYKMVGDFTEDGSVNADRDRGETPRGAGFEEAWSRLKAELAPLGYRFARVSHQISTGEYDNPFRRYTYFIVEWNTPWITSGRR